MEAKELRIGNWINVTFSSIVKQQVVDCMCDSVNTKCHESLPFDFIEPIPLTEEWLLKFGFEKLELSISEYVLSYIFNDFEIGYLKKRNVYMLRWYQGHNLKEIEYVHQLQNLYFALTGEELQIKE